MAFPAYFWIILLAGLVGCSFGFKKFIWFISVGYGMAVSCIGIALGVMGIIRGSSIIYILHTIVLIIYGLRLGLFLLIREMKNQGYRKTLAEAGGEKKIPIPVLIAMWILCGFLYYFQTSGLFYRVANGEAGKIDFVMILGLIISICGVSIEAIADAQKTAQKKENPNKVAMKGLFRMCRCPNYFGEILVWTGVFVSSLTTLKGGQWVIAIIGYIAIVYIMFDGAKRLEIRQTTRCWQDKEYVEYSDKTPIIIPFLPIYHLIDWIK